jgi:hypothetical protein
VRFRGWKVAAPSSVAGMCEELLEAARREAKGVQRVVWLRVEALGETVRVELDHEKQTARIVVLDDALTFGRAA